MISSPTWAIIVWGMGIPGASYYPHLSPPHHNFCVFLNACHIFCTLTTNFTLSAWKRNISLIRNTYWLNSKHDSWGSNLQMVQGPHGIPDKNTQKEQHNIAAWISFPITLCLKHKWRETFSLLLRLEKFVMPCQHISLSLSLSLFNLFIKYVNISFIHTVVTL